ncbi:integrator complex subunit 12-like [Gigantopelta aegis]|uniref:integrator complex subunit 12-like n=1 Tax=Gigantopelta aegis TaxID=1735272 RepID=UPI001B889CB5|nr:integrator complex subunit 12-like [Gigantopelta aegis]
MVSLELDPVFVKALRLLHSNHKDSANQLYNMLSDVIAQRKGLKHNTTPQDGEKSTSTKSGLKSEEDGSKKHEAEKRSLDKIKQEPDESPPEAKKPRRESPVPHEKELKYSKERDKDKERDREKVKREKEVKEKDKIKSERREREKGISDKSEKDKTKDVEKSREHGKVKEVKTEDSSEDEASMDADDFAFGLGISCVVCRQFDVSSGNQLVECQECHNLYHQECHRPTVTEQDVNDPRFVWYCNRCSKTMKKMATKTPKPKSSAPTAPPVKETVPFIKPVTVKTEQPSTLQPFKRLDHKTSGSKEIISASSSKPLSGLASLAANLSGKAGDPSRAGHSKTDSSKPSDSSKTFGSKQESGKTADSLKESSKAGLSKPEPLKAFSALKSDLSKLAVSKNEDRSAFGSALARGGLKPLSSSSKISSSPSSAFTSSKSSSGGSASSSGGKFSTAGSSSSSKGSGSSGSSKLSFGSVLNSAGKPPATGGTATVVNAEKRLQMMKKKAAAKTQEKRLTLK